MKRFISKIILILIVTHIFSLNNETFGQNTSISIDHILRNHLINRYISFGNDSSFIYNEYKNVVLIKWSLTNNDNPGEISDIDICGFRFSEQEGISSLFLKDYNSIEILEIPTESTFEKDINEINDFMENNNFILKRRITTIRNILDLIEMKNN